MTNLVRNVSINLASHDRSEGLRLQSVNARALPAADLNQRLLAVQLPSPPQTLVQLLTLCQSEDTGMAELSTLIGQDPAMTAKVMSVAHSAAFHRQDTQSLTLFQACSRLGTALIKVLVISESVLQTFNAFRHSVNVDLQPFWRHSLHMAVIARELASRLHAPSIEEAYLSGLLHDVGRLALQVAAPADLGNLFDAPDDDTLCVREQGRVGMSHVQAGAWLLEKWHLSAALIDSVSHHHGEPLSAASEKPLAWLLQLAHRLADIAPNDPEQLAKLATQQGLRAADLQAIAQTAALQVDQIAQDLGLAISVDAPLSHASGTATVQVLNSNQEKLARDIFDRSVFNEMAMTLVGKHNMHATLSSMREHASALLKLDDSVVLLLREAPRVLVAASLPDCHRPLSSMNFGVESHAALAACVDTRTVIFTSVDDEHANTLHQLMDAAELVLIPLVTSQKVLGVLLAGVPAQLSGHLKSQSAMLQAFGVYAGLALARRHQADKLRRAQVAVARQEGRLELLRISQQVRQLIEQSATSQPFGPIDLCTTVRDMVQVLQDSQLVPDQIEVRSQYPDRRTLVQGCSEMIKQIVHILFKNACQAMPEGGEIKVAVGALVQRAGSVYTLLSISDTAVGAPTQSVQAELYEPVVGKRVDEQRMQGLSIVNYLAEQMAGQVKFNADESGTRFDVLLPCVRAPGATASAH